MIKNKDIKMKRKLGITFTEIMIATLILGATLLPTFGFLTNSVKDTERVYIETVALNKGRQIMEVLLNDVPWRCMKTKSRNDATLMFVTDDKDEEGIKNFINHILNNLLEHNNADVRYSRDTFGEADITTALGYRLKIKIAVFELADDTIPSGQLSVLTRNWFDIDVRSGRAMEIDESKGDVIPRTLDIKKIALEDSNGRHTIIKKIVLQINYTTKKHADPADSKNKPKKIFFVAFKPDMEGEK